MQKLSIEDVFGVSEQRLIETVGPRPPRVKMPWWALMMFVVCVGLAIVRGVSGYADWMVVDWACLAVTLVGLALFAARLESRVFFRLRSVPVLGRLFVSVLITAAAIACAALVAPEVRFIPTAGERFAGLLLFFSIWLSGAALGGVVMLALDIMLSILVPEFRRRIVVAVLSLVAMAFALCGFIAFRAVPWLEALRTGADAGMKSAKPILLGYTLTDLPLAQKFLADSSAFATAAFIAAAVVMLPAVLSVSAKLAETVMERIAPLMRAFDYIAEGQRGVHLEEAGSPEFFNLALSFNEMVDKLYCSERIERAFGQYVSSQVLDRIRAQRGSVRLPAELRTATVFFADIRGFTTMSERLPPEVVVDVLNRYLEEIVPVVEQYQGFLNKFVGDAVVVVFNGPIDQPDHAERATCCAVAVQQRVAALNAQGAFAEIGELAVGVGVATGPMLCGNVGTRSRLEYTVIGDTVNLASRMTGHARGGQVWVSEGTAQRLPPSIPAFPSEPIKFKGKENAVVPYYVWPPVQAEVYAAADAMPLGRS